MSAKATSLIEPQPEDGRLRQPSGIRLIDDVAQSIEDAILSGNMKPGERLTENRLCQELGVSRTTLREALLILQRRGLLRSEPRRGTFVTRLSRQDSLDLCRARALLESYAVSTGLARLTPADFDEMQDLVHQMALCDVPGDLPVVIRLDHAFHEKVMVAANSAGIYELWSSLNGRMSALILSSIEHHHAGMADVSMFHQVVLDALRTGAIDVARDAVVAHYIGFDERDQSSLIEIAHAIESMTHAPIR